jgi:light-dependent protochlorophyllide reductase
MNTAIVTGANTGLGFECARALAETRDWHVVVACRSAEKGLEAVTQLIAQTGHKSIEAMPLDLASLESVRSFAPHFAAWRRPPLRALVCNAATQIVTGRTFTPDGFETTFAVNHLGHFLLVQLMLPQMAPPARIVIVSSGTHDPAQTTGMPAPLYKSARFLARPDEDPKPLDDERERGTAGRRAYTTSKLCNVLFTYELDRRLRAERAGADGRAITVNAFDPGLMPGTGLARDYGRFARFAWRFVLPALRPFVPNVNSVAKSGRALASMVTEPRFALISGRYFQGTHDVPSSKDSYDPAMASELWESSAAMVKLTPDETILRLNSASSAA